MRSNVTKKTVSARKRIVLLSIGGAALVVAVTVSLFSLLHQTENVDAAVLQSGGRRYMLSLASTQREQQLGLGGRKLLPQDQGMLFIFGQPSVQCFWMKDMHFPIDMIWVSASRRVEYIKANVSPSSYPNTFCPNAQAKYVIELNAGQAKQAHLHPRQPLSF
jgi:uncharacterized membrane protein (UPF0127 family)